ncbi:hypothetical protein BAE44_0021983 [Dichanthelium oligosanthes]|uniref:Uncharacterized protein n=1 Tax=Dichanthelium oligosanthes TaxID=888268 RepID=A0A1E5UVZ7_9POAL|nr:hypothetical protein BAE44_0021983 [Dichanthelium oligosanthes]
MAEQGELPHPGQPAVAPVLHDRLHQHLFVDGARALMLLGAATATSTVGSSAGANATQAFVGFLLWLLGVWLLALTPVARRFPQAALVSAAMANAVLKLCFMPWN